MIVALIGLTTPVTPRLHFTGKSEILSLYASLHMRRRLTSQLENRSEGMRRSEEFIGGFIGETKAKYFSHAAWRQDWHSRRSGSLRGNCAIPTRTFAPPATGRASSNRCEAARLLRAAGTLRCLPTCFCGRQLTPRQMGRQQAAHNAAVTHGTTAALQRGAAAQVIAEVKANAAAFSP